MSKYIFIFLCSLIFALPRYSLEEATSCMACHVNPTGSGMRNDYGSNIYSLDNLPLKHEWVFILDADETLPSTAEDEIRRIVIDSHNNHAGYWINRQFFFIGKPLRHAYFPNWNLRLFKHKHGRYEKLTTNSTNSGDHEIHEHLVVKGSTGKMESIMNHYAFPTIESFVEKIIKI